MPPGPIWCVDGAPTGSPCTSTPALRVTTAATPADSRIDLDIGITRSAPRSFFDAGTVGEYMWIIGHPPTRCDRTWWPLEGPVEYDLSRGKFWLVTILDRLRLQPVHVAPVLSSGPSVTVDASGTIWLASAGELVRISDMGGSMQWPETVDVVVPEP